MTSRDIADLTGKNHSDVKRDIENTLAQAEIDVSKFADSYIDTQNRWQKEYRLPKRECDLVVSGYSVKYRLAIIDRWQELEQQAEKQHHIPQSFAEALRLAADQQEVIQAQAAQIEHQKPAVEFVEKYVESTGNKGFREVCKLLEANESEFRLFLVENKIMYRLGKSWTAYQNHIDCGRFSVSTGIAQHNDHSFMAAKFTPKGIEWVSNLWRRHVYNHHCEIVPQ